MRLLRDLLLILVLLAPAPAFAVPAICDSTCAACVGGDPAQCTMCVSGYYLTSNPGTCAACAPVGHCATALTCTSGTNSQCTQCTGGFYLSNDEPASQCRSCTSIPGCQPGALSCTNAGDSTCASCASGFYRDATGACQACTAVAGCTSALTCTSAASSQCATCTTGRYLTAAGNACATCTPVGFCVAPAIPTCTSATTTQCDTCASGHYLDESAPADTCPACVSIANCTSPLSCTSALTSRCATCADGFYVQSGPPDTCHACSPVAHCASPLTCSGAGSSVCTACDSGYVLVAGSCQEACTSADCSDHGTPAPDGTRPSSCGCTCDTGWEGPACDVPVAEPCTRADCSDHGDATGDRPTCTCTCDAGFLGASCATACSPIAFCTSSITCTSAGDSQCTTCASGHHLVEGTADTCPADAALTEVPLAGSRARLSDLPKKRETQVVSYDRAIDLMAVDPTVSGATLSIFSPTGTSSFTLDLPASQWQGPLPGRRFRFAALGNPRVKILLVNGRLLRITLRGSGAYPLGAPQGSVAASLTIGPTRFCTLFGGTISKDNGVRFVARKAGRPSPTCPVDPADNEAPVAQPNAYETTSNAVGAGMAIGGYVVGNVVTDGPPTDADPEGGALSVHAAQNPTLTIAGAPVAIAPVIPPLGQLAAFEFTFNGRTALFTIASDGALGLTGDASILVDLFVGEDAVFAFDYTVQDALGNESNTAHVTVTIHGSNMSCIVFGRC